MSYKREEIIARYISIPTLMIMAVWLGVNTGPWVLKKTPISILEWIHYLRTLFPITVIILTSFAFFGRENRNKTYSEATTWWLMYGLISLITCINSPRPIDATYWALNYLAVFAAITYYIREGNRLVKTIFLNYLNWIITALFLIILVFVARDVLFIDHRYGWITGYGVVGRMKGVADMAMSRSSGMARFAAVPGIVSFVFLLKSSNKYRLLWIVPFLFSATLIWAMQSRGAILGFTFALAFILIFLGTRSRIFGMAGIVIVLIFHFTNVIPDRVERYVVKHFYRGQDYEELATLTGRTRAWRHAWHQIKKAPLMGRGPQADRYYIKEHVHNTYLYALLQSGFLGTIAFIGGLVWAWFLFFKAILRKTAERLGQQYFLMQVGGILAFFTVRSIPEVCGAMFGVDLLVMLPAMAYLGILDQEGSKIATDAQGQTRTKSPGN